MKSCPLGRGRFGLFASVFIDTRFFLSPPDKKEKFRDNGFYILEGFALFIFSSAQKKRRVTFGTYFIENAGTHSTPQTA